MKITRFFASIVLAGLFLSSCSGTALQDSIDMKITMEPQKIAVGKHNAYKQKATIQWEIINRSSLVLDSQKYPLFLGAGRVNDQSTTLFTQLSVSPLNPGETKNGIYEKTFEAVISATGDYELRFWMNEKEADGREYRVKETVFPFRWETP